MSTTTTPSPFVWGTIELSQVVYVDGVPHVTRRAMGEWLEYADPQKAIDNIIDRNPHLNDHSVPLKLRGTDGKNYDTEVFHPIGFLLTVMESSQPKAHTKKAEIAQFVWHFAGPRTMSFKERTELLKLSRTLLADLGKTKDSFVVQGILTHLREVHLALGQALPDIKLLGQDIKQMALPGI